MRFLLFTLVLTSSVSFPQSKAELINQIASYEVDSSWTIQKTDSSVTFSMIEAFYVCQDLSPLRRDGYLENEKLLYLTITLEDDWNQKKRDSLKLINSKSFDLICPKVIAYLDSINWMVKIQRNSVYGSNCYRYKHFVTNWSDEEQQTINQVQALPNHIIGDLGIFLHMNVQCVGSIVLQSQIDNLKNTISQQLSTSRILGFHQPIYD